MLQLSGGKWRGKRFAARFDSNVRPTAIRAREGLFNVLEHRYGSLQDWHIADLFAGTGALGLEALSRGASHCLFVESHKVTAAALTSLIEDLDAVADVRVADLCKPISLTFASLDLVFLDPPYGKGLGRPALETLLGSGALKPHALVILELDLKEALPDLDGFTLEQDRKWGRNRFLFLSPV